MEQNNYQMRCAADHSSKPVERNYKVIERPKIARYLVRSHGPQLQSQPKGMLLLPIGKQPLLVATRRDNFIGSTPTSDDAPADTIVTIPSEGHALAAQESVTPIQHVDNVVTNQLVPNVSPVDPSIASQAANQNSDAIVTTVDDSKVHSQVSKQSQPIRRKNFWTIEEDNLLLKFVQKYGHYGFW